jgi:hypothetical protein
MSSLKTLRGIGARNWSTINQFPISARQEKKLDRIEFLRSIAKTPEDRPLILNPWHLDYWNLISDLRLREVVVTGCCQSGKTLFNYLLLCFWVVFCQYNVIWAYPTESLRNKFVDRYFNPLIKAILTNEQQKEISVRRNNLFQYRNANASFTFVRSSTPNKQGASVATTLVGEQSDAGFGDEVSQMSPSDLAPVTNRLDASIIPAQPFRPMGTPGAGGGIELWVDRCDRNFYPHCICPSCHEEISLTPKGCLLRPSVRARPNGEEVVSYLSESGKPVDWFYRDEKDAVTSAYFGCSRCGKEIPEETRRGESYFRCLRSGILLTDYLALTLDDMAESVAIQISPLIVDRVASKIIREGLETANSDNWQQQSLGLPSEQSTNQLTPDIIARAIGRPPPDRTADFTIAGIDQGRSEHWMVVEDIYLPQNADELSFSELCDRTIRVVKWAGGIQKTEIPDRLELHDVTFGIIDNEPDIADASRLCEAVSVLEMADQRAGQFEEYKEGIVLDGGIEYPCWKIRNEKYLKQVLTNFSLFDSDGEPIYRLPASWERWLRNPSERSPIVHLCAPSYEPEAGKWVRPANHIDDLYYAFMFAEVAFALYLREHEQLRVAREIWGVTG